MPFKHATLLQASEVGDVVAVGDLARGGKGSSASHAGREKKQKVFKGLIKPFKMPFKGILKSLLKAFEGLLKAF